MSTQLSSHQSSQQANRLKRSFIYRALAQHSTVTRAAPKADSNAIALYELNDCARLGFRGWGSEALLKDLDCPLPAKPNQLSQTSCGATIARVGTREYWCLDAPNQASNSYDLIASQLPASTECLPLIIEHSHAWFVLAGEQRADLMAKLCGVDLREAAFPLGGIVQSSVARVNAVVLHHELKLDAQDGKQPVFTILVDHSYAEYLWEVLLDAMAEYR